MVDDTMSEITFFLTLFSIGFAVLALLLLLIKVLLTILRRMARRHVSRTDLDLIGLRAVVTHTIKPRRPGKIRCLTAAGDPLVAAASSDNMIRSGTTVMITAISQGYYHVLPVDSTTPAPVVPVPPPGQERSDS